MVKKADPNAGAVKILIAIIVILVLILVTIVINKNKEKEILGENLVVQSKLVEQVKSEDERKSNKSPNEIKVLATTLDEIYDNSSWCGTFQLVWNDMLDELTPNGKIENSNLKIVQNLDKKSFLETDLSEEYYYKTYGLKSQRLKEEIESEIKKKFNETSDILDMIDWSESSLNDPKDEDFSKYLFYVMLKREFKFENEFTVLEDGKFGTTENVKYFGINSETKDSVRDQVEVLYYNSENIYAVSLYADDGDEVILVRNPQGKNFNEIYENLESEKKKFTGDTFFGTEDTLKVPNLDFNLLKEYDELKGLEFATKKSATGVIEEAVQTIKFKLDSTGGSIKSEAAIGTKLSSIRPSTEKREFNFDDEFTIFLKETGKDKPYFAANVSNITLFQ